MKVFIAGATGGLGRLAVTRLIAAGHDVTGIARTDRSAALLGRLGAAPARLDLFDADAVTSAVAGHDVVMNLATRIPTGGSAATRKGWLENERLRRDGSRILVDAALAGGAVNLLAIQHPARAVTDRHRKGQRSRDQKKMMDRAGRKQRNTRSTERRNESDRKQRDPGGCQPVACPQRQGQPACQDSDQCRVEIPSHGDFVEARWASAITAGKHSHHSRINGSTPPRQPETR